MARALGSIRLAFFVSILSVTCVHDQQDVRITDEVSCPSCRIVTDQAAVLGSSDGQGTLSDDAIITAGADGMFYISDVVAWPGELRVFGADGRFRHAIGRRGRGPGEFLHPVKILPLEPDVMAVVDVAAARVTVLGRDSLEIHSLSFPPASYAVLDDGVIVAATHVLSPGRSGMPLHVLDSEFRVQASFGSMDPAVLSGREYLQQRAITPAGSRSVWSAYRHQYVIEEWTIDGMLSRRLIRQPRWFPPWRQASPLELDEPPYPRIAAIQNSPETGLLFVVLHVPAQDWSPLATAEAPGGERLSDRVHQHHYFDTIIEVLDPERGRLVATRRFPDKLEGFIGPGLLFAYRERGDGTPAYEILRLRGPQVP